MSDLLVSRLEEVFRVFKEGLDRGWMERSEFIVINGRRG